MANRATLRHCLMGRPAAPWGSDAVRKMRLRKSCGMRFCGQCTEPLALVCPKCQFQNPPGFKFCGQCTAPLSTDIGRSRAGVRDQTMEAVTRTAETSEALEGERKTVTALFADIKGSTELMEDLDPEEARAIIDPALKLMIDAVASLRRLCRAIDRRRHLRAVRRAGRARGPSAARALCRAADAGGAEALLGEGGRRGRQLPIEARVGVNTGEVVVRSITDRRGTDRVHADRAYHQPRLADADRWRRSARSRSARARAGCAKAISSSSRWARPGSKASASRSTFTR